MTYPTYSELPEPVSGFEQERYEIKFVKPLTKVNLVSNPSIESATTGYTAVGGSIARISTQQRRGVYSLQVTPTAAVNDGVYFGTVSLTTGLAYYFSLDFLGAAGVPYKIYFASTAGAQVGGDYRFYGTGKWERVWVPYVETSTTTRRLYMTKNSSASVSLFYVDGLQAEQDNLTSYLDGSMRGFVRNQAAYYWNGAEHLSASTRVQATRSGGQEIDLRDYGFRVQAVLGLGGDSFANLSTENAFLGGSIYERSVQLPSRFDIVGAFYGTLPEIMRNKSNLRDALRYDAGIIHQPLLMKVRVKDECGKYISEPIEVRCLWQSGLPGQRDNYNQERVALSFQINDPYTAKLDGDTGTVLAYETDLGSGNTFSLVRTNGLWSKVGGASPFNSQVKAIVHDPVRGRIYFGGNFNSVGGIAGANFIVYLDLATNTFVAMDSGVSSAVEAIVIAPNGDVYIGGSFLTVGSAAAAAKGFARWNVAAGTWTAFNRATATFARIYSLAVSKDGRFVFGGGDFTDWVVGTGTGFSNYWFAYQVSDGSYYGDAGIPLTNGVIRRFITSNSGTIYFAGNFTIFSGQSINRLGGWDDDFAGSPTTLGLGGANGEVIALAFGPDGRVYAGGAFTIIGGVAAARVAVWNGVKWEPLGSGLTGGNVDSLWLGSDGLLYAGGAFTNAGGVPNTAHLAAWNGSSWQAVDVDVEVASQVVRAVTFVGTDLYIGYDTSTPSTTSSGLTSVSNIGTADTFAKIVMTGPGEIVSLKNYTTGDQLLFDLTLIAGEVAVLDFTQGRISFKSNFRLNLLNTIIPGSNYDFKLVKGINRILLLILEDTAATLATMEWKPVYASLDDTLYVVP